MSHRKLSDADVTEIRYLRSKGVSLYRLSKDFGVSPTAIKALAKGETYTTPAPPPRTIRLLDPIPKFQPLRDPNANQGRSYSLAPKRSA